MIEETVDLVLNAQAAFTFGATLVGAGAAMAAASFAIPAISDMIQPRAIQDSLCDFLPFIELMEDHKTIRCENATWIRMTQFGGAELTLAPYTSPTGKGRAELFLARKQMLDELFKSSVAELRIYQIKSRSPIENNVANPIPVLKEIRQKWSSRFTSVFKLRTYMMISVRSNNWREAKELLDKAEQLVATTMFAFNPVPMVEPDPLSKDPDFTKGPLFALGSIFSPISRPAPRGFDYADRVSALIAADRVSFARNEARGILRFSNGIEDRYAVILGLRDCGDKTSEDILRKIVALPVEATIFQVDRPHDPVKDKLTLEREVKASRFMRLSTRAPLEYMQVVDMVDGADSSARATLHDYSIFYIIYGRTPQECLEAETMVIAELSASGATIVRENGAAQASWFSQAPGDDLWPRTYRFTSSNIAANMYLQRANEGFQTSNWSNNPITYFPTMDGQPYAFQFHSEPSRYNAEFGTDKETIAHGLLIGPTGSGKTAFMTFVASMALSIPNLHVYLFDRLNGCECMTRCAGGDYLSFDDQSISVEMNPFLQSDTPANHVFLQRWLSMIGRVDPNDDNNAAELAEISRCIQTVYDPNIDRRHKSIRGLLNSQFEPGSKLRANLRRWADPDLFGAYFNGAVDALDLKTKRIIGFDMTTVLDNPDLAPAIVDYLVHRIRQVSIETQNPSLIFIDETAPMLDADIRFRNTFVKVGLREGRKVKQAFILAFQDPQAVENTGIGDSIRQQCQTLYFFRNRNTKPEDYIRFNLTQGELDFVTGVSYADERYRYAVLIKKVAQDETTSHSVILNLDLSVLGKHLKVYNSGLPAVTEMRKAFAAYGPAAFTDPYINGEFAIKRL